MKAWRRSLLLLRAVRCTGLSVIETTSGFAKSCKMMRYVESKGKHAEQDHADSHTHTHSLSPSPLCCLTASHTLSLSHTHTHNLSLSLSVITLVQEDIDNLNVLGLTPLMAASERGDTEAISVLLELGARKDAFTLSMKTALMFASARGHADAVKLLIDGLLHTHTHTQNDLQPCNAHTRTHTHAHAPHAWL